MLQRLRTQIEVKIYILLYFKTTVELAGFGKELSPFLFLPETNLYLRLEKVLGPADADLVDVDLALPRQHPQPGVLAQLARRRLTEDKQELAERDVTVVVLVYFLMVKVRLISIN